MKQPSLFDRAPALRKLDKYAEDNAAAARIILADVERYGGEESLMVRCSRMWEERHGKA